MAKLRERRRKDIAIDRQIIKEQILVRNSYFVLDQIYMAVKAPLSILDRFVEKARIPQDGKVRKSAQI